MKTQATLWARVLVVVTIAALFPEYGNAQTNSLFTTGRDAPQRTGRESTAKIELPLGIEEVIPMDGNAPLQLLHLDDILRDFIEEHNIVGLSVAATSAERLVYTRAFGYANLDTLTPLTTEHRIRMGSVSKVVTGIAALRLAEQDPNFDLDTYAYGFTHMGFPSMHGVLDAPEYSTAMVMASGSLQEFAMYSNITVRHLLSHTSGFDKGNQNENWNGTEVNAMLTIKDAHLHFLAGCPLVSAAGEVTDYENHNMGLTGHLIEEVSGKSYRMFVRDHLLDPLGLQHFVCSGQDMNWRDAARHETSGDGYVAQEIDYEPEDEKGYQAGGWASSAADFVQFLTAVDTSGARSNVLFDDSIEEMRTIQFEEAIGAAPKAIAWRTNSTGKLAHNGGIGGGRAYAAMFPADYDNWTTTHPDADPAWEIAPINIAIFVNCDMNGSALAALSNELAEEIAKAYKPAELDYFPPPIYTLAPVGQGGPGGLAKP